MIHSLQVEKISLWGSEIVLPFNSLPSPRPQENQIRPLQLRNPPWSMEDFKFDTYSQPMHSAPKIEAHSGNKMETHSGTKMKMKAHSWRLEMFFAKSCPKSKVVKSIQISFNTLYLDNSKCVQREPLGVRWDHPHKAPLRHRWYPGWWFGTWILRLSIQLGISSSQLTN